jgi:hypothetical protein
MKTVVTNDIYEAAYFLLSGCELVDIKGIRIKGKLNCNLVFTGENITQLQLTYLNGEAEANILKLRRMLGQVHAWVMKSRKKLNKELTEGGQA